MTPGLIVAAPASGMGKTVVTLGLLRRLRREGVAVAPFKVGPDYIDPAFHSGASGRDCVNLDMWAMRPTTLRALAHRLGEGSDLILGEGVMGLFDGAADGSGSTADLAALTGWPVLLVVSVRGQAASAAAVVRGFATHRHDVDVAGVLFNNVGGESHAEILREACAATTNVPVLGCIGRDDRLVVAERHLGLVQAGEQRDFDLFADAAADAIGDRVDCDALRALARPAHIAAELVGGPAEGPEDGLAVPPLGQRIAVARDGAFAFCYPWLLEGWRGAGAEISFFSPLADEAPDAAADAVYLPGGYPELHAARIAANRVFLDGLGAAARRGAVVYGECGGYMVLGRGLIDGDGVRHPMAGLAPLETSFAERHLHLGYRRLTLAADGPLGAAGATFRGHEFHYATTLGDAPPAALFDCADSRSRALPPAGFMDGRVFGSFIHLVDRSDD